MSMWRLFAGGLDHRRTCPDVLALKDRRGMAREDEQLITRKEAG